MLKPGKANKGALLASVLISALYCVSAANAQAASDPPDLAQGNLFLNPGFTEEKSCFEFWAPSIQTDPGVICRHQDGTVWLNHNNTIGDPGVNQTVSGLDTSQEYIVEASWRAGPHANSYIPEGEQPIFSIKLSDGDAVAFRTPADRNQWKTDQLKFKPTSETMTIEFRGEAGTLDGDVSLNWVSLRPVDRPQVAADVVAARTAVSKLIPEGVYAWSFPWSDQPSRLTIRSDGSVVEVHVGKTRNYYLRNTNGNACFEGATPQYCYSVVGPDTAGDLILTMVSGREGEVGAKTKLSPVRE